MKLSAYSKFFSTDAFNIKLNKMKSKGNASKAIETAVTLWNVLKDPRVGTAKKAAVVGALGYLICPIDLMPDPVYIDDIGVMMGVIKWVTSGVKPKGIELDE